MEIWLWAVVGWLDRSLPYWRHLGADLSSFLDMVGAFLGFERLGTPAP